MANAHERYGIKLSQCISIMKIDTPRYWLRCGTELNEDNLALSLSGNPSNFNQFKSLIELLIDSNHLPNHLSKQARNITRRLIIRNMLKTNANERIWNWWMGSTWTVCIRSCLRVHIYLENIVKKEVDIFSYLHVKTRYGDIWYMRQETGRN